MNSSSCGAPATTIPNGFHPKEKVTFAVNSENFHRNTASVHF